jgi:putative ABC transport system permease protein
MIIPDLVFKSVRRHLFPTLVSAGAIALAGGLMMAVWVLRAESNRAFLDATGGFDAVLGARGSKLQLVLNAVFHLDESPGNITAADVAAIRAHPAVALALPIATGDNHEGYRIVGTTPDFFDQVEYAPGRRHQVAAPGRPFQPDQKQAVVGSFVAAKLKMRVGDTFHPAHGLADDETKEHDDTYTVAGILHPTGTPADRVIWIPLEGLQRMSGHDARAATEVSAVLLQLRSGNPMAGFQLDQLYNKRGRQLTLAWPIASIVAGLFDKIAWFDRVLAVVCYLVVAVATACILASLSNAMNERRHEIALLRALGARRWTVFGSIVAESATIAALGMTGAFAVYGVIGGVAAEIIRAQTGVVITPWVYHPVLWIAPLGIIGLAALAGVVPALNAYQTDVADELSANG